MSEPVVPLSAEISARAVVGPAGDAELVVDGVVYRFSAPTPAEADGIVTEFMAKRASQQDRALTLQIEDPDGEWLLTIHPDGAVHEAGTPRPDRPGRRRLAESDDVDGVAGDDATDTSTGSDADTGSDASSDSDASTDNHDTDGQMDTADLDGGFEPVHGGDPSYFSPVRATGPVTNRDLSEPAAPTVTIPAVPDAPSSSGGRDLPTLDDLLATRPEAPAGPAERGWQGSVRRLTGGLIQPAPGRAEMQVRTAIRSVQRGLDGPKTIVVLNPKGGAHKTTATLLIAASFGIHRGGYTLAWDNNETRGTLGWRSAHARHANTAVNLLQDLDRFADLGSARVGDLDNYVRAQGSAQFDVLASDEDAASAASIDGAAFTALHHTLARFYRVMVIDTGNNMRASNWQTAVAAADQLVIVSTIREDTAQSAAWAIDALRATGYEAAVSRAVTVLSAPAADVDPNLQARLHDHFGKLTRAVLDVPHDPALVAGGPLRVDALAAGTREAWLYVSAAVAEGL